MAIQCKSQKFIFWILRFINPGN